MSDIPLGQRLMLAIQNQHEATLTLQEVASEILDHCERMRAMTDRLNLISQQIIEVPSDSPLGLPTVLRNGPIRGER